MSQGVMYCAATLGGCKSAVAVATADEIWTDVALQDKGQESICHLTNDS